MRVCIVMAMECLSPHGAVNNRLTALKDLCNMTKTCLVAFAIGLAYHENTVDVPWGQ